MTGNAAVQDPRDRLLQDEVQTLLCRLDSFSTTTLTGREAVELWRRAAPAAAPPAAADSTDAVGTAAKASLKYERPRVSQPRQLYSPCCDNLHPDVVVSRRNNHVAVPTGSHGWGAVMHMAPNRFYHAGF